MKRNSFINVMVALTAIFAGLTVSSCTRGTDLDEGEAGLSIKAYSPTKVIKGQEVQISGTMLDGVTEVVFPGDVRVTDFVKTGNGLISVITPAGVTQGGAFSVVASGETATAAVPMTIGKPTFNSILPATEAGFGQELNITGIDMEFIESVTFPGEDGPVVVDALGFVRKATTFVRVRVPFTVAEGPAEIILTAVDGTEIKIPLSLWEVVAPPKFKELGPWGGRWRWSTEKDQNDNYMNVWGNGGFIADGPRPSWWGLNPTNGLMDQGYPGEGSFEAGMFFDDAAGTMTKLRDDGTTQTGTYKVDVDVVKKLDWLDYNWSYGSITFTDVAPLVPKHGDLGDAVVIYTYDILERPDLERDYINSGGTSTKFNRRLSLSMASEGTGSWGTAYYWVYEQVRDTVRVEPATLGLLYGERVVFDDEEDMAGYWLDYDCFIKSEESNTLIFVGGDGNYKISRDGNDYTVNNEKYKHIAVEAVDANGEPATTQADGSGAVWVIGNKIGKPSFESNDIAGDGSKALCMIPIGGNKYRITLVPGVHIDVEDVDFKFYYGKGTDGGSFTASNLTTESEYVTIASDGTVNKADDVVLRKFVAYEFILDLSAGRDAAVLTVNEIPPVF